MIYEEDQLQKLTKFELLDIATELDVKYRTRMAKPKLVASILEAIAEKKKDFDPKAEAMLGEQEELYKTDIESSQEREDVSASKYTKIEKKEAATDEPAEYVFNPFDTMDDHHQIPDFYGEDKVVAMIVDPTNIHIYWETTHDTQQRLLSEANAAGKGFDLILKLHDVTDVAFNGSNSWSEEETNVGFAKRWYFEVTANRSYCAEIGMRIHGEASFIKIARSNIINTPRDTVSDFYDEEWMMIDFNNNKTTTTSIYSEMYRLSGGYEINRYQLNSEFITERTQKPYSFELPTVSLSSESLSSQMMVRKNKDFWLWVDTELVVYGQTKSDAKELTINGENVKLDDEGRFRLHMALPNGEYPFHVKAVSSCGDMVEEVTPKVLRVTELEKVRTKG